MTTPEDLQSVVKAERARIRSLGLDCEDVFIPSSAPKAILPPEIEPPFTFDELILLDREDWREEYYNRSGRYLGIYPSRAEAESLDRYRFTRCFLPGNILPWEVKR